MMTPKPQPNAAPTHDVEVLRVIFEAGKWAARQEIVKERQARIAKRTQRTHLKVVSG